MGRGPGHDAGDQRGSRRGHHRRRGGACSRRQTAPRAGATPGTDWAPRFRALLSQAEVEVVGGDDDTVYARTNQRIIDIARKLGAHPRALIVWDGQSGDGPGGTSDFVEQFATDGDEDSVTVIDPTPRAHSNERG
jgi:hypothetical protein